MQSILENQVEFVQICKLSVASHLLLQAGFDARIWNLCLSNGLSAITSYLVYEVNDDRRKWHRYATRGERKTVVLEIGNEEIPCRLADESANGFSVILAARDCPESPQDVRLFIDDAWHVVTVVHCQKEEQLALIGLQRDTADVTPFDQAVESRESDVSKHESYWLLSNSSVSMAIAFVFFLAATIFGFDYLMRSAMSGESQQAVSGETESNSRLGNEQNSAAHETVAVERSVSNSDNAVAATDGSSDPGNSQIRMPIESSQVQAESKEELDPGVKNGVESVVLFFSLEFMQELDASEPQRHEINRIVGQTLKRLSVIYDDVNAVSQQRKNEKATEVIYYARRELRQLLLPSQRETALHLLRDRAEQQRQLEQNQTDDATEIATDEQATDSRTKASAVATPSAAAS